MVWTLQSSAGIVIEHMCEGVLSSYFCNRNGPVWKRCLDNDTILYEGKKRANGRKKRRPKATGIPFNGVILISYIAG